MAAKLHLLSPGQWALLSLGFPIRGFSAPYACFHAPTLASTPLRLLPHNSACFHAPYACFLAPCAYFPATPLASPHSTLASPHSTLASPHSTLASAQLAPDFQSAGFSGHRISASDYPQNRPLSGCAFVPHPAILSLLCTQTFCWLPMGLIVRSER